MSIALIAAFISSVSISLMIIFDRLMVNDCYDKKPGLAWFVSSVVGGVLGFFVTGIVWLSYYLFSNVNLVELLKDIWYPYGLWMILAGAFVAQYLRYYFRVFIPENDTDDINETGIAMWLASSPVFIILAIMLANSLGINFGIFQGLEKVNTTPLFILGVLITTVGLVAFEKVGNAKLHEEGRKVYAKKITIMMLFIVIYTLIVSSVMLTLGNLYSNMTAIAFAVLPFYWIGFSIGALLYTKSSFRTEVKNSWSSMTYFVIPIFVAEIIGMSIFFFEYIGLSGVDPTLVNLILSTSVLLVYFLNYILKNIRTKIEKTGAKTWNFLSFTVSIDALPKAVGRNVKLEIVFIILTLVGLNICLQVVM